MKIGEFNLREMAHAGERPRASPLSRYQASRGAQAVTNLLHATVDLKHSLARQVLVMLDGRRDRAAIVSDLARLFRERGAYVARHGEPVGDAERAVDVLQEGLEQALSTLAEMALLMEEL